MRSASKVLRHHATCGCVQLCRCNAAKLQCSAYNTPQADVLCRDLVHCRFLQMKAFCEKAGIPYVDTRTNNSSLDKEELAKKAAFIEGFKKEGADKIGACVWQAGQGCKCM